MHRARIMLLTRRAQIIGLTVLALAGALAVLPASWAVSNVPAGESLASVAPKPVPEKPKDELPDVADLADAIRGVYPLNMPRDPKPADVVADKGDGPSEEAAPPVPPAPPKPAWKYIGSIAGPGYRRAVVSVDDKQQLVSVGESVQADEVVEIGSDRMVVRAEGVDREIPLAERVERPAVATVGGPPGSSMPGGAMPVNTAGMPSPPGAVGPNGKPAVGPNGVAGGTTPATRGNVPTPAPRPGAPNSPAPPGARPGQPNAIPSQRPGAGGQPVNAQPVNPLGTPTPAKPLSRAEIEKLRREAKERLNRPLHPEDQSNPNQ